MEGRFDHCFMRIVLDNMCGQKWNKAIESPAYQHMTEEQMQIAIQIGELFLEGEQGKLTLREMDDISRIYRNNMQYNKK